VGFQTPFVTCCSGCLVEELDLRLCWLLAKDTLHSCGRDAMTLGDLSDALATLTVLLDSDVVQYEGGPVRCVGPQDVRAACRRALVR